MKALFNTDRFGFKALNALALNALVFNICVPSLYAMGTEKATFPVFVANNLSKTERQETVSVKKLVAEKKNTQASQASVQVAASGPGQAESNSFSINSNDNILNKFTGDMAYSIPLMDVDGYPLQITYNPNITMDQEASWVGLGWDLPIGSINREMRGIPDDFKGDLIARKFKAKNEEVKGEIDGNIQEEFAKKRGIAMRGGTGTGLNVNLYGIPLLEDINFEAGFQYLQGKYYNSYNGVGHTKDLSYDYSVSSPHVDLGLSHSHGWTIDDQNGIGITKGYSLIYPFPFGSVARGMALSYNSREGILSKGNTGSFSLGVNGQLFAVRNTNSYSSMMSFGKQTYIPKYNFVTNSYGESHTQHIGITATKGGFFGNIRYVQEDYNDKTSVILNNDLNGYGYFNYTASENDTKAMLDFNRDSKNEASSESMHLNFSQPTFDLFYCNAPGINTNFRAHRYDIMKLHDPKITNTSVTNNETNGIGAVVGKTMMGTIVGVTTEEGGATVVGSNSTQGVIEGFFDYANPELSFNKKEYYLKTVGENTFSSNADENSLYNDFEREYPARLEITVPEGTKDILMTGNMERHNLVTFPIPANTVDMSRKDNIIHYREYQAKELEESNKGMYSYPLLTPESTGLHTNSGTSVDRTTATKKDHHIQAIEVVNEYGARYFFGIPNYSYQEKEITFSVNPANLTSAIETGICQYDANDASISTNTKGRSEMYESQVMPAYAHSFLLSELYSNDYVDLTGNGPSRDDIGNYHKLNYTNVYGEGQSNGKFNWRMPLSTGNGGSTVEEKDKLAYYQQNLETDPWDDMAFYSFGEKDIWYTQSIESKDMVAFFRLEARKDMYSIASEVTGAQNGIRPGYLLKKIELYSKNDLETNQANAVPLQVVEFEYDYSLCQDYPGNKDFVDGLNPNNDGKLTLKAVYSYTGKSKEFKTTPYRFEYSIGLQNPSFKFSSSDRWGNYKPNNTTFPNHMFPYAEQDEATANDHVQAWKMRKVLLPEGGEVEFEYASDSYAYVEDKRAMRMFSIEGASGLTVLGNLNNQSPALFNVSSDTQDCLRDLDKEKNPNEVLYFKLAEPITASSWSTATDLVKKQYFTNEAGSEIHAIVVNLYADLGNKSNGFGLQKYEYVHSFVPIEQDNGSIRVGVVGDNSTGVWDYGFIILEKEGINENNDNYEVTALQLANWQFARRNTPYLLYGDPDYSATSALEFCDYSAQLDGSVIFGLDLNKRINKKDYGLYFKRGKSQMRLFEPDNKKLGGGAKVVSITYRNNWNNVSAEAGNTYKWEYVYEAANGSYGVASYEPQIGTIENSLYQLTGYELDRHKIPDEKKYHFSPVCDMMYPVPIVGYSRIESSFSPDIIDPERSVGKNVEQYFTSRDFPLKFKFYIAHSLAKVDKMAEDAIIDKTDHAVTELLGLSEGFYVQTNDMHGKLKMLELYDSGNNLISSQEYIYADPNTKSVGYLKESGVIIKSYPPREIEMYVDSWQNVSLHQVDQKNENKAGGVILVPNPGGTPPFIPIPFLDLASSSLHADYKKIVKAFTFTKAVHQASVLLEVKSTTLGSVNSAKNELFDFHTGQVLLSSLKDEFNDTLYSFSYPAHWAYRSFLNMSKMDGYVFSPTVDAVGNKLLYGGSNFRFTEGDHFKITKANDQVIYAWAMVVDLDEKGATLIDAAGESIDVSDLTGSTVEVLRTGRKNRIAESMMAIRTKRNPYDDPSHLKLAMPGDVDKNLLQILDVSAVIYSDKSQVPCPELNGVKSVAYQIDQDEDDNFTVDQIVNPFLIGAKGNYQLVNTLAYQSGRLNNDVNDVRQDGEIDAYEPFYSYKSIYSGSLANIGQFSNESKKWYPITSPYHPDYSSASYKKWRLMGKIDHYDEQHNPVQVSNPLRMPSSHLKLLNENHYILQEATASNAAYSEIGFDGFEFSVTVPASLDNGFNLNEMLSSAALAQETRHSGKYALRVPTTASATFAVKDEELVCSSEANLDEDKQYHIRNCDCIPNFEQETNKTYLLSVWVKETTQQASYANTSVKITFSNAEEKILLPSGPVIDGWQKIEGEYSIPDGVTSMQVDFINSSTGVSYFDDFRTHPVLAAMQSIVYDEKTLLPLASHDAYNFTTFYNYDDNHQLVRVKVETVEGIRTISETQSGTSRIGN